MDTISDTFDKANRRATEKKAVFPAAVSVRHDRRTGRIVITLVSGLELGFSPKLAQGLENAQAADLADAQITPSGLGVHFPHLDADLYIPALLEGFLGSRRWLAAEMGKLGGSATTKAKAAAARRNGKLGGRPRKPKGLIAA